MRVLTTKQLTDFYGVDQINIKMNFSRNKEKYFEGKHYVLLQGDDLRQLKQLLSDTSSPLGNTLSPSDSVSCNHEVENFDLDPSVSDNYIENFEVQNFALINLMNTKENNMYQEPLTICLPLEISTKSRHLYLWTERGALLHAKSINTDKAWDVYEQLLDVYFRTKEVFAPEDDSPVSQTHLPKVPNWHSMNYRRIDNLCSVLGIDRKHMYHLVLMRCSETYDLNEAKMIYKRERGFAPQYAIDIVGYFPELKEIADDYLDELELLYRREVVE